MAGSEGLVARVIGAEGAVVGERELPASVFGNDPRIPLLHQVVVAEQAAARAGTHSTKTRAEVSGGGAKPFRQKGTGNARQGSIRAPQYKGGGVVHGPRPRDYSQKLSKKMVRGALCDALSDRAQGGAIYIFGDGVFDAISAKVGASVLGNAGFGESKVAVIAMDGDATLVKSLRNLAQVRIQSPGALLTSTVLSADAVIFTESAFSEIVERLSGAEGRQQ